MKLSPKATRFIIAALEHYVDFHDQRLAQDGLSEDEISDFTNDRQFLQEIKRDLEKQIGESLAKLDKVEVSR